MLLLGQNFLDWYFWVCFVLLLLLLCSPGDTPGLPSRATACFYACLSHATKFVSKCACQASTVSHTSTHTVIVHVLAHPHGHLLYCTHTHMMPNVMNWWTGTICSTGWLTLHDPHSNLLLRVTQCLHSA